MPVQHSLTPPNVNDIDEGVKIPIKPGAIYVFDKGYCDYNWWSRIDASRAQFVTRFKRNAALTVEEKWSIPPADAETILKDEIVCFANRAIPAADAGITIRSRCGASRSPALSMTIR